MKPVVRSILHLLPPVGAQSTGEGRVKLKWFTNCVLLCWQSGALAKQSHSRSTNAHRYPGFLWWPQEAEEANPGCLLQAEGVPCGVSSS
jgi:hypothetical protein